MGRERASWGEGAPATVTGAPGVGNQLTAALSDGYTATGYQWLRNGVAIAGATAATYVQQAADIGATVTCQVTGMSFTAPGLTTPGTGPAFGSWPVLLGTPTVGTPVAYVSGGVTGTAPVTVTAQWLIDGAPIAGETGATYTPLEADAGKTLALRQLATNTWGGPVTGTSAGAVIQAAQPATYITDETGAAITDEAGAPITTE